MQLRGTVHKVRVYSGLTGVHCTLEFTSQPCKFDAFSQLASLLAGKRPSILLGHLSKECTTPYLSCEIAKSGQGQHISKYFFFFICFWRTSCSFFITFSSVAPHRGQPAAKCHPRWQPTSRLAVSCGLGRHRIRTRDFIIYCIISQVTFRSSTRCPAEQTELRLYLAAGSSARLRD